MITGTSIVSCRPYFFYVTTRVGLPVHQYLVTISHLAEKLNMLLIYVYVSAEHLEGDSLLRLFHTNLTFTLLKIPLLTIHILLHHRTCNYWKSNQYVH